MRLLWQKYRHLFFYGIFGVLTTVVNILSFALCYEYLKMPNIYSNIVAWVLAVTVAYITNKLWVFDSKTFSLDVLLPEIWRFFSCRLVTGIMDLIIMWVGVDCVHGPATFIKVGSNIIVIVLNYVFSKILIFKKGK